MVIYAGNLAPFLMHLRIILLWSFMLIAGWMRETHHLKYSYESAIIWLWNIETWKKRTVAYKNETQLTTHEPPIRRSLWPNGDHLWSKNLIVTRNRTTSLRMLRWFATGGFLFPKGRSQWVTRVISTSGDSHMSHLHFWFTCSCLHFALDVVPKPVSPPQVCSLC